ncbi:hypothetical protein ABB37_09158 [Leptomonas pyrrhocoris]|uniref:Leucine-rich repeat protein (LRRP) n=1 Tax=Leptomonas pyrrhocoris TaxID=157538 RepID=A0A0N0VD44_LEPPY|nr:hypothetical protein ABB37_09158 [Leptomonas pyrrhocoris]XP_015652933.1 hypothetical protein ABB37_09158 [Leptomonas pyrrhocoris]KPA74493.1 hypothetical protein ABB37_09158 [Leptomonas pyrrhocoris]KPA74494.1 hypothetical protein ABB37_09158 [Leptomonas pyrrhocoris]|eukprot:XP_015652932.1 hypothetical protein ABB37_09158 [Leptomonas pyrrhocoris]
MLFFWNNGFLRPLISLGVWLFGNNENEVLTLDNDGERYVDAYGSEGSPFARLVPDLHGGDRTAGLENDVVRRVVRRQQQAHAHRMLSSSTARLRDDTGACMESESEVAEEEDIGNLPTYLCTTTLQSILEYRLEFAPLPLAVAAAGPRLRLAGELTSIFYFPGAACCVRAAPSLSASSINNPAAAAASSGVYAGSFAPPTRWSSPPVQAHESPPAMRRCSRMGGRLLWGEARLPHTRKVHGTSLAGLTRAMRRSAWWYGRITPAGLHGMGTVFSPATSDLDDDEALSEIGESGQTRGAGEASMHVPHDRYHACLPLCVEVVAPRVAVPTAAPQIREAFSARAVWTARVWGWVRHPLSAAHQTDSCGDSRKRTLLAPLDAELQVTVLRFVTLMDQLWCERRCALTELAMERFPIALAEWMLSPDLHPISAVHCPTTLKKATSQSDMSKMEASLFSVSRGRRAFRHVHTLKCRGRVGQASAEAMSAANAVARGTTPLPALSAATGGSASVLSLSFTSVQPHLRVLDLSSSAVASLSGVEAFPLLEKVTLTGCAQLSSLSPLGLAPALREIVASQSGIYDVDGLARSSTLVSLSLYGCLNLTDVSACGRIPTLRDLFISESTVEVVEGLQESRSLVRLGMRYCDVSVLAALSSVSSLRILHASSSTLTSVAALQYCVSLEVVEVAACAQLIDVGPLGLAPRLLELDASGSGVRHVDGLRYSGSLEKLLLAQCTQLEDCGLLGRCVRLRQLSLTGTRVRSLDGLAGAPALMWLDVSFCRQLANFGVLLQLPQLRQVMVRGCTEALRRPEDAESVMASLCARRKRVVVIQS